MLTTILGQVFLPMFVFLLMTVGIRNYFLCFEVDLYVQFTQVVDAVQSVKMTNARGEVKYPIKVGSRISLFQLFSLTKDASF